MNPEQGSQHEEESLPPLFKMNVPYPETEKMGSINEAEEAANEVEQDRVIFQGQDAEVTVERYGGKRIEGGWEVVGFYENNPDIVQVQNIKSRSQKPVELTDLIKLQPFKEGESVSVIRDNRFLDKEKWKISMAMGNGNYHVVKVEGKVKLGKWVTKKDLIKAQIAELKVRKIKFRDVILKNPKFLTEIERDVKYWQDKLETVELLDERNQQNEGNAKPQKAEGHRIGDTI